MELKSFFKIVKNQEKNRWEFTPNSKVKSTSYTVSFVEADNENDAWISLYCAINKSPDFKILNLKQ